MHGRGAGLVIREDQTIRQNNILPPTSRENHNLCDIISRQRLTARIHSISFALVAIKPHDTKLSLDLPRIHTDDPHSRRDELFPQTIGERSDGRFGRAVDSAAGVWLAAGDRTNVDDVANVALQHSAKDFLGHVDEAGYVGGKHDVHVVFGDLGGAGDAFY